MSVFDAAGAAITGWLDTFDKCRGLADKIIEMIDEDVAEYGPDVEYTDGGGDPLDGVSMIENDVAGLRKAELNRAKTLIDEAELICQNMLADL
jgi:hypothetical protein